MAHQATGLARAVAQFRLEEGAPMAVGSAPHATSLPRSQHGQPQAQPAPQPQAVGQRPAPALAAGDADDWKEF